MWHVLVASGTGASIAVSADGVVYIQSSVVGNGGCQEIGFVQAWACDTGDQLWSMEFCEPTGSLQPSIGANGTLIVNMRALYQLG